MPCLLVSSFAAFFPLLLLVRGWGKVGLEGVCVFVCIVILWWFMPIAQYLWDLKALLVSRVSRDGSDKAGSVGVEAKR